MKKLILSISSLILMVFFLVGFSVSVDASSSTSWNFKDSSFKSLGTISSTTTIDLILKRHFLRYTVPFF